MNKLVIKQSDQNPKNDKLKITEIKEKKSDSNTFSDNIRHGELLRDPFCSHSPISSPYFKKENEKSQSLSRDKYLQDEQPFVISKDQEIFDIMTPNFLTKQQRNNKSIFCVTTEFRSQQQDDALSTKYFCGGEHVLKSTGVDITFPLGNQFMDIRNLLPHYENELFMGSIPPDKNITLHNSGQPSPSDLGAEHVTSS